MQSLPNQLLFRTFSANDWNQLSLFILSPPFGLDLINPQTNFSNAEKLRKIVNYHPQKQSLELMKSNWSIGFTILFPLILESSKIFTLIR